MYTAKLNQEGWNKMEKYWVELGSNVPRPVMQLFLDLCQICQATRGWKSTQNVVHKPIIPVAVRQCAQADLVDSHLFEDYGGTFTLNYQ